MESRIKWMGIILGGKRRKIENNRKKNIQTCLMSSQKNLTHPMMLRINEFSIK